MGWQRSSMYGVATISRLLKITGLFCKEPYKRDYILQKRPMLLRSLHIVTTPLALSIGTLHWHSPLVLSVIRTLMNKGPVFAGISIQRDLILSRAY